MKVRGTLPRSGWHLLSITHPAYRVPKSLGLIPGRVTYVIDREGIVRHAFNSQTRPAEHVEEALGVLKKLS